MSFSAGGLEIQLALDMAQATSDANSFKQSISGSMSQVQSSVGAAGTAFDNMSDSAKRNIQAMMGLVDASNSASYSGKALIANLKDQIATFGMSKDQLTLYRAQLHGVGDEAIQLVSRLKSMKDAQDAFASTINNSNSQLLTGGKAADDASGHMDGLGLSTAGARRELIVLGHEVLQGNWTRFGGSLMVLAERMDATALLFNPMTLGLAAFVAAGAGMVAMVVHADNLQRQLIGLSAQLEATGRSSLSSKADIKAMIDQLGQLPDMSRDAAQAIVAEFAQTHQIGSQLFGDLGRLAADFAVATGTNAVDAAKTLAKAFADPAQGAKELDARLGTLSSDTLILINRLIQHNDVAGAQKVLYDELSSKIQGLAKQSQTELQTATESVTHSWQHLKDTMGESEGLKTANQYLVNIVNSMTFMIQHVDAMEKLAGLWSVFGLSGFVAGMKADVGINTSPPRLGQSASGKITFPADSTQAQIAAFAQQQQAADSLAKSILNLTSGYSSQASHQAELVTLSHSLTDAINKEIAAGNGDSETVKLMRDRLVGLREAMATTPKDATRSELELQLKTMQGSLDTDKKIFDDRQKMLDLYHNNSMISDREFFDGKKASLADYYHDEITSYDAQLKVLVDHDNKDTNEQNKTQLQINEIWKKRQDAVMQYGLTLMTLGLTEDNLREKEVQAEQNASDKTVAKIYSETAALQDQIDAHGKVASAITAATIARLQDQAATLQSLALDGTESDDMQKKIDQINAQITALEKLRGAQFQVETQNAAADAAKKAEEAWNNAEKSIEDGLYNAISHGGSNAFKKLLEDVKNWFAHLILNPIIQPIAQFGASLLNPTAAGATSGGFGNLFSLGSTAYNAYNGQGIFGSLASMFGGGAAGGAGAGASSLGAGFASLGADAAGGGFAAGASAGIGSAGAVGAGAAELSAGAGGAAMGAVSAIPVIGWFIAAAMALNAIDEKTAGETRQGGQYAYKFPGQNLTNYQTGQQFSGTTQQYGNVIGFSDMTKLVNDQLTAQYDLPVEDGGHGAGAQLPTSDMATWVAAQDGVNKLNGPSGGEIVHDQVAAAIQGTVSGINTLLGQVGSKAQLTGFQAGLESSTEGRGGVFAGGTLTGGTTFGLSGTGSNYSGTEYDPAFSSSPDSQTAFTNFVTELKQTTLQALAAATDIPKSIKDEINAADIKSMTDADVTTFLTNISAEIASVKQFQDAITSLPFANLKTLSFDVADALIKVAGGLQNLQTKLGTYTQDFYSQSEIAASEGQQVAKALSNLGFSGITTSAQFRALVDGFKVIDDTSAATYNSLLDLAPAFKQWQNDLTQSATAVTNSSQALSDATTSADSALTALGNSINAQKTNLQNIYNAQVQAINDAATAQKAAAQVQLASAQNVLSAAQSIAAQISTTLNQITTMSYSDAQSKLIDALAQANAGVALSNIAGLQNALTAVSKGASTDMYVTLQDMQRDQIKTANAMSQLNSRASEQVNVAQMIVDAVNGSIQAIDDSANAQIAALTSSYNAEVARLDGIMAAAQQQVDALKGVDNSVKSVDDSLQAFQAAIGIAQTAKQAVSATTSSSSSNYASTDGGTWSQTVLQSLGINGSHASGLDYVPFNGYRAELHQGERVQTAKQAKDSDAVAGEIRQLHDTVQLQQATLDTTSRDLRKLTDMFEIVTEGGKAMLTTAS